MMIFDLSSCLLEDTCDVSIVVVFSSPPTNQSCKINANSLTDSFPAALIEINYTYTHPPHIYYLQSWHHY